ncbi:MAG: TonB-dependent receptor [Phenylobacterium sp.]
MARSGPIAACVAGLALFAAGPALAQRASENALATASDAFGASVGQEITGIYSEGDVRGFSPQKAGNLRIEGVYYDPSSTLTARLKASTTVRVGFAALGYPFPAPTGVVDYRLRNSGNDFVVSTGLTRMYYGGLYVEADAQVPIVADRVSVAAGANYLINRTADGASLISQAVGFRPRFRFGGVEVSPFYGIWTNRFGDVRPVITAIGPFAPPVVTTGDYFGQPWANARNDNATYGVLASARLGEHVAVRGGVTRSYLARFSNYSEVFRVFDPSGLSDHIVVSDPKQKNESDSWEGLVSYTRGGEASRQVVWLGARGRHRTTETGGSDSRNLGPVLLGQLDLEPRPTFVYGPINVGEIRQTHLMLGGLVERSGWGQINVGLQHADYEASFVTGAGLRTQSSADPWLYNVSVRIDPFKRVSFYAGHVRGLEDSGTAPESAANRNEQLPATLSEQYDGGMRVQFPHGQLVASAFQITKPYFTFDAASRFVEQGEVRHRGVEVSYSGRFFERLQVLAGAVFIDPRVSGEAVQRGVIGERAVGVPDLRVRIDASWRTDIWNGLTPTAAIVYIGERAGSANRFAALGGRQVVLEPQLTLDLGVRYAFKIDETPMSLRVTMANVFDRLAWRSVASNTYQMDDRRRLTIALFADF